MPTYEYNCEKCGHHFEVVQSISADPLQVCPEEHCPKKTWGKGRVKRAIGMGAGIIFKGSGFYTTDYRSESYKAAAKRESEAAKPSAVDSKTASTSSAPKPAKTESTNT
ncbi:MAG: zinc ribbon domain-containing protein [Candidatus Omnitrophica bacterium]|nr:zinc ribbon domain-containing protein [Candidatus Omnitrophota bacterium]